MKDGTGDRATAYDDDARSRNGGNASRRDFLLGIGLGAVAVVAAPFLAPRLLRAAETGGSRVLIVYFSHSGNTRRLAELIHEQVGGDMVELKTVTPYPQEYDAVVEMAKREQQADARPLLATELSWPTSCRTVFIGYPNWWGTFPMPVFTFLETHNPGDRTVIPFCTHGGGRFGRSERDLRRLCPQARILKGFEVRGSRAGQARGDVETWLRGIGMTTTE